MDISRKPIKKVGKTGLIPAAGFATRIGPLPCSKEIYPLGLRHVEGTEDYCQRVACHCLLESMAKAEVDKCYVILRSEKWDIPSYLGDGKTIGINLAYLVVERTNGAPFTLDRAFSFVEEDLILFGFPDILFTPDDAFSRLLTRQRTTDADIVLGLYRAHKPHKMDMIDLDSRGRVRNIIIKPTSTSLEYTWIIAVWTGAFTRFMHSFLTRSLDSKNGNDGELYVGDVVRAGMHEGLHVETVMFSEGNYVDVGTPEDLIRAVQENIQVLEGCGV